MRKLIILLVLVTLTGCSAAPAAVSNPNAVSSAVFSLPTENGAIVGTPPQVLQAIQASTAVGKFPIYHGSSAFLFVSGPVLRQIGGYSPEMIETISGNLLSWEEAQKAGACWLCLTRHTVKGAVPGIRAKGTDLLWTAMEGLDSEVPGSGYQTAAHYANNIIRIRRWDPGIAAQKLAEAEKVLATLTPDTPEYQTIRAEVELNQTRINWWNAVNQGAPDMVKLVDEALDTPIVAEMVVDKSEITRIHFSINQDGGVGTKIRAGTVPFTRFTRVYVPKTASQELVSVIRQAVPQAEVVLTEVQKPQSANMLTTIFNVSKWNQSAYTWVFQGATISQRIMTEWLPALGAFTLAFTPVGIKLADQMEVMAAYDANKGLTNLTGEEWYEAKQDWVYKLLQSSTDPVSGQSLYGPLMEVFGITPDTLYQPWVKSGQIALGGSGLITPRLSPNTSITSLIEALDDTFAVKEEIYPPISIRFDGWTDTNQPIVTLSWDTDDGPVTKSGLIGAADQPTGYFVGDCQTIKGIGYLNQVFALRWITTDTRDSITVLMRPYFYISEGCHQR